MSNFGWKLCMYWGSHWRTYFGLYYAHTFDAAYKALSQYSFPQSKKQGWAIKDVIGKKTYFSYGQYLGDYGHAASPPPVDDGGEILEQEQSPGVLQELTAEEVAERSAGVLFISDYGLGKSIPRAKRRL